MTTRRASSNGIYASSSPTADGQPFMQPYTSGFLTFSQQIVAGLPSSSIRWPHNLSTLGIPSSRLSTACSTELTAPPDTKTRHEVNVLFCSFTMDERSIANLNTLFHLLFRKPLPLPDAYWICAHLQILAENLREPAADYGRNVVRTQAFQWYNRSLKCLVG